MKRKFTFLGLALASLLAPEVRGQSVWPSTLNATGGYNIVGGNQYDYSIGEIALVNTFTTHSIIVTNGLLQTELRDGTDVKQLDAVSDLLVFPNPTKSIIYVQLNAKTTGKIKLSLHGLTGSQVAEVESDVKAGVNMSNLDMGNLANATYILYVMFTDASGTEQKNSYKIQKIQ